MQKIYRILRNNKELGPFELDELVHLPVQPTDLVWQDGKSAAWLYPSEIDTLKTYSAFAPDPASSVKASAPVIPMIQQPVSELEPVDEEMLTSEKLEKKAEEIFQRVQAYSAENKEPQAEIKYARSLEDLKYEYADWLHKKKTKKRFVISLQLKLIALSIFIMVITGVLLLGNKEEPARIENISTVSKPSETDNTAQKPKKNLQPAGAALPVPATQKESTSSVDAFIDSVRRVLAQHEKLRNSVQINYRPSQIPVKIREESLPVQDTIISEKPVPADVKLLDMHARYVSAKNGRNLESVEVSIQNNSDNFLKAVSVDVFYYKKGEKLFDKRTLYFNNIQPGNTYTLSVPANKKALEARFKLGTVNWNN